MYALFAICNVLSPSRLDDNISNIVKERFSEQLSKMTSRNLEDEAIPVFEDLFLHSCPKFMCANPPPYDDPAAISAILAAEPLPDPARRHLSLFLDDVRAQAPVATLRSFLKLYTSLDAKKLANFLDADEEDMVQEMMAMKVATRSVSRVGNEKGYLEGTTISTSDLNFVITEVSVFLFLVRVQHQLYFPRTWCTSPNPQLVDVTRVGSSGTPNTPSECTMVYATALFLPRRRNRRSQQRNLRYHQFCKLGA